MESSATKSLSQRREAHKFLFILQYVETLQEQLAELESSGKIDVELLCKYKLRTQAISGALRRAEVPELCRLVSGLGASTAAPPSKHLPPTAIPGRSGAMALPIAPVSVPKISSRGPGAQEPPMRPFAMSDAAKARLKAQGATQEALTDELVELAAAMKSNTLTMESKVKERGELLESTETALDKSLTHTKSAAARATAAHKRGRLNFCLTCLVLLIIAVGFVGMYLFIRITSFTGYKAAKIAANVPPTTGMDTTEL